MSRAHQSTIGTPEKMGKRCEDDQPGGSRAPAVNSSILNSKSMLGYIQQKNLLYMWEKSKIVHVSRGLLLTSDARRKAHSGSVGKPGVYCRSD